MTDAISDKLIDEIVRRVVETMGGASDASAPAAPVGDAPPPPADPGPLADGAGDTPAPRPAPASRVWLTVEMLTQRAGAERSITLAPNEFLTPAARDYASSRGVEVVRGEPVSRPAPATVPTGGEVRPAVLTRTLGLVVSRPDAKVAAALAALARGGVATEGFGDADCWMANARAMCEAVRSGRLAGGAVVERYAAAPMVLVAKIRGIRPVQGVSVAAVEAALRQFDANVLVVGHATLSVFEVRSMIDRFAAGRRVGRDRTALLDAVEELEAPGTIRP